MDDYTKLLEFLVDYIKQTPGPSLDMRDNEGFTPLARAAQEWRVDVVERLSAHGALDWGPIDKSLWAKLKNLPPETTTLDLRGCAWLKSLPENLPPNLTYLDLTGCSSLQSLPENLPKELTIRGWKEPR